jgi:AraC-like DNA-binding protein
MAKASEMLRNAVPRIKTVAYECGYSVVSNFSRDFKRVHGMSPMQMRLRHIDLQARGGLLAFTNALSGQSEARQ